MPWTYPIMMKKIIMLMVLLASYLWTDAANAQVYWEKYQVTDEMTGKTSEPTALIAVNWGNVFFPEVHLKCFIDQWNYTYLGITLITLEDTMPHLEWYSNQYTYESGYRSPIRIAYGNGDVELWNVYQGNYVNKFEHTIKIDATTLEPNKFKLELVADNGDKYHIGSGGVNYDGKALGGSNGYLVEHLTACKNSALKAVAEEKAAEEKRRKEEEEAARAEQAKETAQAKALQEYTFEFQNYFIRNLTIPKKIGSNARCEFRVSGSYKGDVRIDEVNCWGDPPFYNEQREKEVQKLIAKIPQPKSDIGNLCGFCGEYSAVIKVPLTDYFAAQGSKIR